MPFPVIKLAVLGFKQASKYVGEVAKRRARESKRLKNMIIKAAGWYHVIQTKSQLSVLGMGKVKNVKPLSEKAAIDLGANIVGDFVMILCAFGIYYIFEKSVPSNKEEEITAEEIQILKETVVHQSVELERQAEKLKDFERVLGGATIYSRMSERVMAEMTGSEKIKTKT